jgi:probable HAF family extracellular repeat protein
MFCSTRSHAVLVLCSLVATVTLLGALPQNAQAQTTFTPLGFLPGGHYSVANGVSSDGNTIVGGASNSNGNVRAFRWTASGGMQNLGVLSGGVDSIAYGVSDDGNTIAGYEGYSGSFPGYPFGFSSYRAFRWTPLGMQGLGFIFESGITPGVSYASGISGDGNTIVGYGGSSSHSTEAYRWTASTGIMQGLGSLTSNTSSYASDVSNDGNTVVGNSYTYTIFDNEAFRWTPSGGMQGLGILSGGSSSYASGVSDDGNTVVGNGTYSASNDRQAFRWTASGGMQGLGFLSGDSKSFASDVSGDGNTVVGSGESSSGSTQAFIWTAPTGTIQRLQDVLIAGGATNLTGWTLRSADAVSNDGNTIVGYGTDPDGNQQAFRATLNFSSVAAPEPTTFALLALGSVGFVAKRRKR